MKYFENFPSLVYTFDKNTVNIQAVTDILARSTFLKDIVNNVDLSYAYEVKEEDTPEIIAYKAYGDAYRSWIILLFNNIINPYYDWPMKGRVLETYILNKYGQDVDQARSTIHHYEQEIKKVSSNQGVILNTTIEVSQISDYELNFATGQIVPRTLPGVADTSLVVGTETTVYDSYTLTVTTTNKAVSNYTYEFNENEKRRQIKILDKKYVQRVETEFREIMSNG